jgi:beta-glucanase (GH16 family)
VLRFLAGSAIRNVEAFTPGGMVGRATLSPHAGGGQLAEVTLNPATYRNGPLTVYAQAWDAPAQQGTSTTKRVDAPNRNFSITGGSPLPAPPIVQPGTVPLEFTGPTGVKRSLFFHDEFDGVPHPQLEGRLYLDQRKWKTTFWQGSGARTLAGNGEAQYYFDPFYRGQDGRLPGPWGNPFEFKDGVLSIKAQVIPVADRANWWAGTERHIASGLIISDGMENGVGRYGYMELRAKLTNQRGSWPAWWTLPNLNGGVGTKDPEHAGDHPWPPEIDMIEAFGHRPTKYTTGLQSLGGAVPAGYGLDTWMHDIGDDLSRDFHIYGFEWTENDMVATFDGRVVSKGRTPPAYRVPMYQLINLAVGGNWYRDEKGGTSAWDVDEASMPWRYDLDYIRWWR